MSDEDSTHAPFAGASGKPEGGIAPRELTDDIDHVLCPPSFGAAAMRMDPNTEAFVKATAGLTSIAFTTSVLNVLAVILSHLNH